MAGDRAGAGRDGIRPRLTPGAVDAFWRGLAGARRGWLELVLPVACVACGGATGGDALACPACWTRLTPLPKPRCERCGHPTAGRACRFCPAFPPYVRAVRSVCWARSDTARALLFALKYDAWPRIAEGMAERMARLAWPEDVRRERTALIPVPLAPRRRRERGYNQSEVLAEALGRRWEIPVWKSAICRLRETTTQTRLTPGERSVNVRGAFSVPPPAQNLLRGAHVVLVDDVLTTGATALSCAAALHAGGARIVSIVTFARAPASGDRG